MPPRKTPAPVVLSLYTIYYSPAGHRGSYVVRRHVVTNEGTQPTSEIFVCDTLDEARSSLPPWLYNSGRMPDDHESIVETWL